MANYTCVAENIAGKRTADPVSLTVYGKYSITHTHRHSKFNCFSVCYAFAGSELDKRQTTNFLIGNTKKVYRPGHCADRQQIKQTEISDGMNLLVEILLTLEIIAIWELTVICKCILLLFPYNGIYSEKFGNVISM